MSIAKTKYFFIVSFILFGILGSCKTAPSRVAADKLWTFNSQIEFNDSAIQIIQNELKPLNLNEPTQLSVPLKNYCRFYDLNLDGSEHYIGTFISSGIKISAHVMKPLTGLTARDQGEKGTVILIHGYLDHTATYTKLINTLIENNYTIIAIDLPGHGFSEGKKGKISDFAQYGELVNDVYKICQTSLPAPYHIIGHSTGCSAIIEYLSQHNNRFTTCVFTAPLIRTEKWGIVIAGYSLFGWMVPRVPSITNNASTNQDYNDFIRYNDPLHGKKATTAWVRAMLRWNKKIQSYAPISQPIVIIQGTKDESVEWSYNLPFISQLFANCKIHLIQDAGHTLFCELPAFREKVIQLVLQALQTVEKTTITP